MNKKSLTERDIYSKYIATAIQQAGWDMPVCTLRGAAYR